MQGTQTRAMSVLLCMHVTDRSWHLCGLPITYVYPGLSSTRSFALTTSKEDQNKQFSWITLVPRGSVDESQCILPLRGGYHSQRSVLGASAALDHQLVQSLTAKASICGMLVLGICMTCATPVVTVLISAFNSLLQNGYTHRSRPPNCKSLYALSV